MSWRLGDDNVVNQMVLWSRAVVDVLVTNLCVYTQNQFLFRNEEGVVVKQTLCNFFLLFPIQEPS